MGSNVQIKTIGLVAFISFLLGVVVTYVLFSGVGKTSGKTVQPDVAVVGQSATSISADEETGQVHLTADGMENTTEPDREEFENEAYLPSLHGEVGNESVDPPPVDPPPIDPPPVDPLPIVGFGVLGDSNSDEYRADDNRGGDYAATTLNWVEQLALSRDINFGDWGTWDKEPRRTGFEYNWALSAASVRGALLLGQHTGVAQQVAAGEVSHVYIFLGVNDFGLANGTYAQIYNGDLDDAALQEKIDGIVNDLTTMVDTILNAGEVQMIVVPMIDPGDDPSALAMFPDPARRQRVTDAVLATNAGIEEMAASRPIALLDVSKATGKLYGLIDDQGIIDLDGELIDVSSRGDEPHNWRLDDDADHAGTVAMGLFANFFVIEPFNEFYGLDIPLLSDQEILENAGIR